jgi:hypothetical protein
VIDEKNENIIDPKEALPPWSLGIFKKKIIQASPALASPCRFHSTCHRGTLLFLKIPGD